jgi:hypothetical protein
MSFTMRLRQREKIGCGVGHGVTGTYLVGKKKKSIHAMLYLGHTITTLSTLLPKIKGI